MVHTIVHHVIPKPHRKRHTRVRVVKPPPDPSGYVIFLDDNKKLGAVRVIGRKDIPASPIRIMAYFKVPDLRRGLQHVYDEIAEYRITGDWYVQDAVEMYLDHRQGRA